jgi:hypothetical protein
MSKIEPQRKTEVMSELLLSSERFELSLSSSVLARTFAKVHCLKVGMTLVSLQDLHHRSTMYGDVLFVPRIR